MGLIVLRDDGTALGRTVDGMDGLEDGVDEGFFER